MPRPNTFWIRISARGLPLFIFMVAIQLQSPQVNAATLTWKAFIGDWNDPANWGGTLPTSLDEVSISNDGTAMITEEDATCKKLTTAAQYSGNIQMTGGSLTLSDTETIAATNVSTFFNRAESIRL